MSETPMTRKEIEDKCRTRRPPRSEGIHMNAGEGLLPDGWKIVRAAGDSIVITHKDGSGCVVDMHEKCLRQVPSEILYRLASDILTHLASLPADEGNGGWISVADKLPEPTDRFEPYLVIVESKALAQHCKSWAGIGVPEIQYFHPNCPGSGWSGRGTLEVAFWRPLPKFNYAWAASEEGKCGHWQPLPPAPVTEAKEG